LQDFSVANVGNYRFDALGTIGMGQDLVVAA